MAASSFAIGVDYGTNSVRALVVDVATGEEDRHARVRLSQRRSGDPARSERSESGPAEPGRLHRGFLSVGRPARCKAPRSRAASRPTRSSASASTRPVRRRFRSTRRAWRWRLSRVQEQPGGPCLALERPHRRTPRRRRSPSAPRPAARPYLAKCGGTYSSEWYWSKILHCMRTAPEVAEAAYSWVELADFVPGFVTGNTDPDTLARGICAAGHKAMYHDEWGGLPSARVPRCRWSRACRGFATRPTAVASNQKAGNSRPRSPEGRPAGGDPRGGRRVRRPHGRGRSRLRQGHPGEDHRHQHLRLHARADGRTSCPTFRASAASCPGRSCPACTAWRRASRPWATSSTGSSSTWRRPTYGNEAEAHVKLTAKPPSSSRASRAWWRSTGTTATARSWSIRC